MKEFEKERKNMLALALYEYSNACPEEFIILKENNYDGEDFQKAILKSKEIYDNSRYESVCVVEIGRKVYDDFLKAKRGEDEDYDLSDWQEEHYEDIDTLFTSDDESIPEEVYFKWQEWYKKEWIIDVTKQEIERLAKYENKGYKWVPKP